MRTREWAAALLVIAVAAVLSFWTRSSVQPPEPLPSNAPAVDFSAARAMKHVEAIAQSPHAVGQPGHDEALRYVLSQFTASGLEPRIQETVVTDWRPGLVRAVKIRNALARLPGAGAKPAVLLLTHYDSVPTAPGASDAAHGVAVLLETLRALRAGPPLKRDVILLVTDAEERGLLGASAFLKEHPWRKDFDLVINFEARGTSGASIMFETGPENGWLIREFALAAPYPVANSLSYEVYKRLPNDTDFTLFKRAGYSGLNFAYIGDAVRYHTMLDNAANLDRRSLQHAGSSALALARHFGNLDAPVARAPDAVYFNLPVLGLVVYPASLALPLAIGALVLYLVTLTVALRRRAASWKGLLAGAAALPITAAGAGLAAYGLWRAEAALQSFYRAGLYDVYGSRWFHGSFSALTLFIAASAYAWLLRKTSLVNLLLGGLLWWLGFTVMAAFAAPGLSYLFFWPAVAGLGAAHAAVAKPHASLVSTLIASLSLLVTVQVVLGTFPAFPVAQSTAAVVLVVLSYCLLLPAHEVASRPWRWVLPTAFAAVFLAFLIAVNAGAKFDSSRPKPDSLIFACDAQAARSYWISADSAPDGYTTHYLGPRPASKAFPEIFPLRSTPMLFASAAGQPLPPPALEDIHLDRGTEAANVRFRLRSARQAPMLTVWLEPGIEVLSAKIDGAVIEQDPVALRAASRYQPPARWSFSTNGFGDGVRVELSLRAPAGPLRLLAIDSSYSTTAAPRPPGFMPRPGWPDSTSASKLYELK